LEKSARRAVRGSAADMEVLRRSFVIWESNRKPLDALIESNPALREIGPVADAVARVGALGLEAIDSLQSGRPASQDWIAKRKSELNRCAQPRAELVIAAARPVGLLLEAIELRTHGASKPKGGATASRGN
jgi:hypothetical protein